MKKRRTLNSDVKILFFIIGLATVWNQSYSQEVEKKHFKHASVFEFFFEAGHHSPKGAYADDYKFSYDDEISESLKRSVEGDTGGFGALSGFNFKIGGNFYLGDASENLNAGIRVTVFAFHTSDFKWETDSDYIFKNASYTKPRYMAFSVGPFFRYMMGKNVSMRIYYQLGIRSAGKGGWDYSYNSETEQNNVKLSTDDKASFTLGKGSGLVQEWGLEVTYRRFVLGLNYSWGKIKYKESEFKRQTTFTRKDYDTVKDEYVVTGTDGNYIDEFYNAKAPTNYLSINIGYIFAKSKN